jgi:hypothetical protein
MSLALNPPSPARGHDCPSTLGLEAFATGEVSPAIGNHLSDCASCALYVQTLRAHAAVFTQARPAELFIRQLQRRSQTSPRALVRPGWALATLALVALTTVVVTQRRFPAHDAAITFKGSFVGVHLQRGTETRPVEPNETLRAFDALRFTVRSDKPGFAAVLEKDAAGGVTVVAPFAGQKPQRVTPGSTVLDDSAVLDAATGEETFVAVFSEQPFDLSSMTESLREGGDGNLRCDGCRLQWLRFDKRP